MTEVPDVMRAAVLFGPNDLRVVSKPVPRPAHDEVLVRVRCAAHAALTSQSRPNHSPRSLLSDLSHRAMSGPARWSAAAQT